MSKESVVCKKFFQPFFGFILAIFSICLAVLADLLVKKATFFNSFENAFIRFTLQLLVLMAIACYNGLNPLGPAPTRKILVVRGVIGALGLSCKYTAIKLLAPSDLKSFFRQGMIVFAIIFGRLFLGEKIGTVHVFSMGLLLSGVVSIAQPTFLMNILPGEYVSWFI